MPRHEVDSVDNIRPRAGTLTVEHAHAEQAHVLSHTESLTADDAGNVRAVPIAVEAGTRAVNGVVDSEGTPLEFPVRGENTGINDIGVHARTIVDVRILLVKRQ